MSAQNLILRDYASKFSIKLFIKILHSYSKTYIVYNHVHLLFNLDNA